MKRLSWSYCECGCHGHQLNLLRRHFWFYQEYLEDRLVRTYLFEGHGFMGRLMAKSQRDPERAADYEGIFAAADRAVIDALKPDIPQLHKELHQIEEFIGPVELLHLLGKEP